MRQELTRTRLSRLNLSRVSLNAIGERAKQQADNTPYIKGHVTDGSSTFVVRINGYNIVVPVGEDGRWKWEQDRTINSLSFFYA